MPKAQVARAVRFRNIESFQSISLLAASLSLVVRLIGHMTSERGSTNAESVSFKICPFVQRVTALLEAKRIPYEIEYIDLNHKPQWFLEVSPNGQVPILITESGDILFESDAIVEYIEEVHGPLNDVTPTQRAKDRAWSYQASKHYLVQCSAQRSVDEVTLEERAAKLRKAFAKIELELDDGPYFGGEILGTVDISWLPLLHRASIIEKHTGYDFLEGLPGVKSWQSALLETDIVEGSVSDDFEERFTEFYLAEDTYLGALQTGHRSEGSAEFAVPVASTMTGGRYF